MNILVLCTGNSARSILLEAILNRDSKGRIRAWSAGSKPTGRVHPESLALLKAEGYATDTLRSKSWDEFAKPDAPEMDAVITVCGNANSETCPLWPGTPVQAHWGVEDPAAAPEHDQPQAFEDTYQQLFSRAQSLFQQPFDRMNGKDLTTLLKTIGKHA